MALGVITEFVYSILHSPKTCNIEYGQWLAMPLVKSKMGRGWHWGWCGSCCHNKNVYSILHGQKSWNIECGQWLALPLVKSEMGRGWHVGW